MKTQEAIEKLKSVKNYDDFQNLFFSKDEFGDEEPTFEIVYMNSEGGYTYNPAVMVFNRRGNCTNSYMQLEDGYLPYPF